MESKLKIILDHYGIEHQAIIWIEELSELTKELCKYLRNKEFSDNGYLEITDVQNCLDQMKIAFNYPIEKQYENYNYKVERTLKNIRED